MLHRNSAEYLTITYVVKLYNYSFLQKKSQELIQIPIKFFYCEMKSFAFLTF